jgi:hypothetical protein
MTLLPESYIKKKQEFIFMRGVVLVIASLAPFLSFIAHNPFYYSIPQIFVSLIFLTFFCTVFYWSFALVINALRRGGEKQAPIICLLNIKVEIVSLIVSIVVFVLLCFLFCIYWLHRIQIAIPPILLVCFFSLFLLIIGLGYSSIRSRIAAVIVHAFFLISIINLFWGISSDVFPRTNYASIGDTQDSFKKVQFKVKPNIYLFLLESFHSREVLNEVYGVDTTEFTNKLLTEGYILYDPVYANYYGTIPSVGSLFRMNHTYFEDYRGMMDVSKETSRIISGASNNSVLNTLKNNGYSIAYILSNNYLYRYNNKNIDYTNLNLSISDFLQPVIDMESVMYMLMKPIVNLNQKFKDVLEGIVNPPLKNITLNEQSNVVKEDKLFAELVKQVQMSKSNKPVFRFIYWIGASHVPIQISRVDDKKNKLEFSKSWVSEYKAKIQKSEMEIIKMIQYINQEDSSALVVLIGDHGAFLKYGMILNKLTDVCNIDDLKKTCNNYNFTLADLAKDVSSVFFAIKWPKELNVQEQMTTSHVNLFRMIFSVLSEDDALMQDRVANTSYFLLGGNKGKVFMTIKEGVVMDEWKIKE